MSNRITKVEVASLRELERQATRGFLEKFTLAQESRNLLPALLDTLDEAMEALADAELEFMSDISTVGWTFEKGGKLNQVRERARALLAAWNAGKGSE